MAMLILMTMITIAGCGPRGNLTVEEKREAIVENGKGNT
jgi:predicted small lipoprotein YifL